MTLFVPRLPFQPFHDQGFGSGGGASNTSQSNRDSAAMVDVAELATIAARHVASSAARRQQAFSFDYRGMSPLLMCDSVQMHCAMHRLLWAVIDMLDMGLLLFSVEVADAGQSQCRLSIVVAGTGRLDDSAQVHEVLRRLDLHETSSLNDLPSDRRLAHGICPNTGARVEFSCMPHDGVRFEAELVCQLSRTTLLPDSHSNLPGQSRGCVDAQGERAWLIGLDTVASQALACRLQRLGWAVTRFDGCTQALDHRRRVGTRSNRPVLAIVNESNGALPDSAQALCDELSSTVRMVLAVMPGSPLLGAAQAERGFEVCPQPFSPAELTAFTVGKSPGPIESSGDIRPLPSAARTGPWCLSSMTTKSIWWWHAGWSRRWAVKCAPLAMARMRCCNAIDWHPTWC